jgi:hypothetical protein
MQAIRRFNAVFDSSFVGRMAVFSQGVKKNWLELEPWIDWWHIVQA